MPEKFPIGKPSFPSWGLPILALSLAVLVHGLWLVAPQYPPEIAARPHKVRLYAYPNLDTRVWSPTLFSLPSSMGFSGAMRQNASNVLPPLKSPVRISRPTEVSMDLLFTEPVLQNELPLRSNLPVTLPPIALPVESAAWGYVWQLDALNGPKSQLEINRLPVSPPGGGPLVVTGTFDFDRGGQVQSLILDPPALSPDLRTQVIRALRRVRQIKPAAPRRVRFRFAYVPAAEEERE